MGKFRCGEIVGKCLKDEGVEYVFGMPGHGNIGLIDGIYKEDINFITCHHETIAGKAADGYFRLTHKPGIVCLTCGPGAFNASLAVVSAAQECSAVIYLLGDIPSFVAGRTAYEEFDVYAPDNQFNALRPLFKRAWKVQSESQLKLLPQYIANAFNTALTGQPGPVMIDVPFDFQKDWVEIDDLEIKNLRKRRSLGRTQGDPSLITKAADLLAKAKSPVILAGGGVKLAEGSPELTQISELLNAPVVTSIAGTGTLPENHRNSAGFIGSYGRVYSNELAKKADVLLAIGTRFEEEETSMWLSEYVFQIPPTKLIQIDIEPREIGKNYPAEVGIVADAKSALSQLIAALKNKQVLSSPTRIDELQEAKKTWFDEKMLPFMTSEEIPLNPRRILKELEECTTDEITYVIDPSWSRLGLLQQFPLPSAERAFVVSGMLPIGWSTAAALGMCLAKPESKIVAIQGDGGFLLSITAIATAVEYELPITWIVLNNRGYNALAVLQRAYFGGRTTGSEYRIKSTGERYSPDYPGIARAFGADGERIEKPEQIRPALERGLKATEPYVLDFVISGPASRLPRTAQVSWAYLWGDDRE